MENVGGDGFEILHQMDVLSAEAEEHQGSVRQYGQLQSTSASRRGAAKIRNPKNHEKQSIWKVDSVSGES